MPTYLRLYPGVRWSLQYGSLKGVERTAVIELQRTVQRFLPYVLTVCPAAAPETTGENVILAGTAVSNPLIRDLVERRLIAPPAKDEGYTLACLASPWKADRRVMVAAGSDAQGALHGVTELCAQVLPAQVPDRPTPERIRERFDQLADFSVSEAPAIQNRGIWTWGYVVYDYRRFLDNMARLKMNMLTLWNDVPPVNVGEICDYAHARGIKIILGFPWGWGFADTDLSRAEDRARVRDFVVNEYRTRYADLPIDGIYFQTLTEHHELEQAGRPTIAWVCDLVNETAARLYAIKPDLYIQFGLHATSVGPHAPVLKALDPRMVVVWEDAGVLPFSYDPVTDKDGKPAGVSLEETLNYSKQLVGIRPGVEFGMVPKGWIHLRWSNPPEFEHHGPFILGERSPGYIRKRLEDRQPLWDRRNRLWIENARHALRFYREILACHPARMTVTGLVEDGLFEEKIQPSVALFAEMLWNPQRSETDLVRRAASPYLRPEGE
jgi:hypothetical protein